MNNTQNSFKVVKISIIVSTLIIALVAIWYFAIRETNNSDTSNKQNQAAQTNNKETDAAIELGKECVLSDGSTGTQVINTKDLYSLCLPNGWTLNSTGELANGSAYLAFAQDMQYNPASKPSIKELGGTDSLSTFSLIINKPASNLDKGATANGKVGKLSAYYFEQKNASEEGAMGELPNGTKEYTYRLEYGGQSFEMSYRLIQGAPDQTKLVNAIAESFIDMF